jgi:hypothetical protein
MLVPEGAMAARGEMLMAFFVLFVLIGRRTIRSCPALTPAAGTSRISRGRDRPQRSAKNYQSDRSVGKMRRHVAIRRDTK